MYREDLGTLARLYIYRVMIFEICLFCNICLKNMVVRYRGINNKGVLGRPSTKWKVLRTISSSLKVEFTVNLEN